MSQKQKEVINEQELCSRLELTRPTIRRLRLAGLPCLRAGGAWRYDWERVLEWMEEQAALRLRQAPEPAEVSQP